MRDCEVVMSSFGEDLRIAGPWTAHACMERRPRVFVWRYCVASALMRLSRLSATLCMQAEGEGERTGTQEAEDSDQALIASCLSDNGKAFRKLVERYEGAVARVLWHFTRDRRVLDELVQDTFVEAYFSLRRFRRGAPFMPWIRVIATRVGYRSWRRNRRERDRDSALAAWRLHVRDEVAPPVPSEAAERVFGVLELLEPKDRLVLTLQYFEGCSTSEIAERMGWGLSRVKVRALRARRKLRALLEEAEQGNHGNH